MSSLDSTLDEEQESAVYAGWSPLLILAGPGSGKTRVLTERTVRLVNEGIEPERILLLTFTQRAAQQMVARLESRLGERSKQVWAGTFHSIGARLLRLFADEIGLSGDFSILSSRESYALAKSVALQIELPAELKVADILAINSFSQNSDRPIEELLESMTTMNRSALPWVESFVNEYLRAKIAQNKLDYDDLLSFWYLLLCSEGSLSHEIQGRFDAVLVDEYQDVCALQALIVDRMGEQHRNITVVGDDQQSIYSFRGADVSMILGFIHRHADGQLVTLKNNYRSTPQIVTAANDSIANNRTQYPRQLVSVRADGPKPTWVQASHPAQIAQYVTSTIQAHHEAGVPLEEISILYRTHAQARSVQLALQSASIPFTLRSGPRLLERPHVRPLVSLIETFVHPMNNDAWFEVLTQFEGLGSAAAQELSRSLASLVDPWELLRESELEIRASARFSKPWRAARVHLSMLARVASDGPSLVLAEFVSGVMLSRLTEIDHGTVGDLEHVVGAAVQFSTFRELSDHLRLAESSRRTDGGQSGVTLSTVHRAKGLEWAVVFVIGLNDGTFPLTRFGRDAVEIEEERRLFYVAMTRASRWLYLAHSWSDSSDRSVVSTASQFLEEINSTHLGRCRLEP